MEVLYRWYAGLDVHAKSVTCVRLALDATITYDQYTTTTRGLLALDVWLVSHGCTHVAMEATGVYWRPGVWRDENSRIPGTLSDLDAGWTSPLGSS